MRVMNSGGAIASSGNLAALSDPRREQLSRSVKELNLVIAGATGRVGSALCRQLRDLPTGIELVGIANSSRTLLRGQIDAGRGDSLIHEGGRTGGAAYKRSCPWGAEGCRK